MQMKSLIFLALIALGGCRIGNPGSGESPASCQPNRLNWHYAEPSPPNRVLVWNVVLLPDTVRVNGYDLNVEGALKRLGETRGLRPSPYLVLSSDGHVSCDEVRRFMAQVEDAFGCDNNYCFAR